MSIDTLISDIHELFDGPHEISAEAATTFGSTLAGIIVSRLSEDRQGERAALRMSNIGRCNRKLYLDAHSEDAEDDITPQVRLKFLYGDIIEALLLFLAEQAGHVVEHQQIELDLGGIKGHIDAVIDGHVVDVKSASSRSFQKFRDGSLVEDDPFGYMEQLSAYSAALKLPGAFLAMNKETAGLTLLKFDEDFLHSYQPEERIDALKQQLDAPDPPERPHSAIESGKSGNMQIPRSPCSYCSRKNECWQDVNDGYGLRTFIYASGPVHLTEVVNLPKVPEVQR